MNKAKVMNTYYKRKTFSTYKVQILWGKYENNKWILRSGLVNNGNSKWIVNFTDIFKKI